MASSSEIGSQMAYDQLLADANKDIVRLEAEIERLRAALQSVSFADTLADAKAIARIAVQQSEGDK